ncbi:MAG: glycosyltransferase family 2 protein [Candidatus Omnitrophica bacterium]|nr:glycosyltransferase family 2 protein [Candidatus Omnitrophota bacterium]
MASTIAIIIPVLNERMFIIDALQHASCLGANEIIVVDGNSSDGTYELIKKVFPGLRCLKTPCANRAVQMNAGANEAVSDILVFLHADSRLPDNAVGHIQQIMQLGFVGGGFMKKYTPSSLSLNIYEFLLNHVYLSALKNLVGTNAIYVRRDLFEALKGFPEVDFMEDVVFAQMLKKSGRVAVIKDPVIVSARRYWERGVFKQITRNFYVMFNYLFLGQQPKELKKLYAVNCYEC